MAPRPALTSVVSRPGSVQSGTGQVAAIAGLRGLRDAEGPAVEAGDQKGRKDSAHGVWEGLDDLRKGGHHALPGHEEAEQPDDWVPTYGCDGSHAESLAELCRAAERVEGLLVEAQEGTRGGVVGGHSHAHLGKEPSLLAAVVSGIINFLLMFGLCCAYGMIMFDEVNAKWQSLGVKMSLATSAFCGLIVAACSRIPVAIAGPDLNPIVFLGSFVATMAPVIAASVGLSYPGQDEFTCGRRLESRPRGLAAVAEAVGARLLGAAGGAACAGAEDSFCREGSDSYDAAACSEYNQQLVTTTIFAVAFSSALLGLLLFLAGRFNLSRYVNYVPTSISEAFLSCVGYKVFAYALKFCKYDPKTFLPAVVIGVILYFLKANHIGNPAVVIPSMLLIPLAIFHVLVAYGVFYEDLEHARTENVMFPIVDNIDFWTIWAEGVFDGNEWKFQHINFAAWLKTIPDLVTMIIVVMVDCLLKLKGTENKLPVVPEVTYECQLYGACNALMCLCGSPCGYMQLKFNVINFGILGNAKDRRGGIIYALLCAVCFLWTTAAFNYLPRFFLGMLLFFAGAGFVAENLYGSSKYMSFKEWLEVIAILLVFIISGQLIYAVGVGILLTATFFTLQYASLPLLSGEPCRGGSITSHARRNPLTRMAARHIANAWFFVMPLKGYIFFASAKKMVELVKASMQSRSTLTICLYASGGDSLGLELRDCGDGKSLEVTGIASDGAVAEWNRNNPKETIERGDKIVNVIPGGIGTSLPPLSSDPMSCHSFRRLLARGGPLHISLVRVSSHHYKRTRFAILDCSLLDGMDASACAVFRKLITEANGGGTKFLWTNLAPPVLTSLKGRGVIADPSTCFRKLNDAVFHVEELVLQYRREKVDQWLKVHPDLRIRHKQVSLARSFEPFTHVFEADAERRGCPWLYCSRLRMHRFRTILWGPGQEEQCLFLIHSGAVGIYASLSSNGQDASAPGDGAPTEGRLPFAMYQRGSFVNRKFILHGQSQDFGVATQDGEVLSWNAEQWGRMSRQRPLMAAAILKAVMRQQLQEAEDSQAAHGRASSEPRREGRPPAGQSRAPAPGGAAAWDAPAGKDPGMAAFPPHLPREARLPVLAVGSVRALGALGLWSPPEPPARRPPGAQLPRAIREDLDRAFDLYCSGGRLPRTRIREALMLAGIFGVELSKGARSLSHDEFLVLGHEACVARLSVDQRERLLQLFRKYDLDGSGTLDRHELPEMFIKEFSIPASVVDSISHDVDSGDGCIDQEGFLWIVARLIRTHENDFTMWKVLCELTGSTDSTAHAELTVEMLKERSSFAASDEEWEEMCWAVDLSAANAWAPEEPKIDFSELVTMVIAQDESGPASSRLPPAVGRAAGAGRPERRGVSLEGTALEQEVRLESTAAEQEVRDMVLDRRASGPSRLLLSRLQTPCQTPSGAQEVDFQMDFLPEGPSSSVSTSVVKAPSLPRVQKTVGTSGSPPERCQWLHSLLEDPTSSPEARLVSVCIGVLIVLCILNNVAASLTEQGMAVDWSSPFWVIDFVLATLFAIEFTLRAVASGVVGPQSFAVFLFTMRNFADFCAILPSYLDLVTSNSGLGHLLVLRAFRLLRLAQLARLGRLSKTWVLAAPVTTVLVIVWGIYLKESIGQDAGSC